MMELREWIKGLRQHLRLKQAPFGELFGLKQSSVSRWERGAQPEYQHMDALEQKAAESGYPPYRKSKVEIAVESLDGWTELDEKKQQFALGMIQGYIERVRGKPVAQREIRRSPRPKRNK